MQSRGVVGHGGSHAPAQTHAEPARSRPGHTEQAREAPQRSAGGGGAEALRGLQRRPPMVRSPSVKEKAYDLFEFVGGAFPLEVCRLALDETGCDLDRAAHWLFEHSEAFLLTNPGAANRHLDPRPRRTCSAEKEQGCYNERAMTKINFEQLVDKTAKEEGKNKVLVKPRASQTKSEKGKPRENAKLIHIEEPVKGRHVGLERFPMARDVPEIERTVGKRWAPLRHKPSRSQSGKGGEGPMHVEEQADEVKGGEDPVPIELYDKEGAAPVPVDIRSIKRRKYTQHNLVDPLSAIGKALEQACTQREGQVDKIILYREDLHYRTAILKRVESDRQVFGQEILAALRGECNPNVEVRKITDPNDHVYHHQHTTGGGVYGIFAKLPIKAGTILGQYVGEIKAEEDSVSNDKEASAGSGEYSISLPDWLPDWFGRKHGVGKLFTDSEYFANEMSYINDAQGSGKPNNCIYMGGYCNEWPFVVLTTILDLEPGDQVYVEYGKKNYWNCVHAVEALRKKEAQQAITEYEQEVIRIKKEPQQNSIAMPSREADLQIWTREDRVLGITEDDSVSDSDCDDDDATASNSGQQESSSSSTHVRRRNARTVDCARVLEQCDVLDSCGIVCRANGRPYNQEAETIRQEIESEAASCPPDAKVAEGTLLRLGRAAQLQRLAVKKCMEEECSQLLGIEHVKTQARVAIDIFEQPHSARRHEEAESAKMKLVNAVRRSIKDLYRTDEEQLDKNMEADMLEAKDSRVEMDAESILDMAQRHAKTLKEQEEKRLKTVDECKNILGLLEKILIDAAPVQKPAGKAASKRKKHNWGNSKAGKSRKVSASGRP